MRPIVDKLAKFRGRNAPPAKQRVNPFWPPILLFEGGRGSRREQHLQVDRDNIVCAAVLQRGRGGCRASLPGSGPKLAARSQSRFGPISLPNRTSQVRESTRTNGEADNAQRSMPAHASQSCRSPSARTGLSSKTTTTTPSRAASLREPGSQSSAPTMAVRPNAHPSPDRNLHS